MEEIEIMRRRKWWENKLEGKRNWKKKEDYKMMQRREKMKYIYIYIERDIE